MLLIVLNSIINIGRSLAQGYVCENQMNIELNTALNDFNLPTKVTARFLLSDLFTEHMVEHGSQE